MIANVIKNQKGDTFSVEYAERQIKARVTIHKKDKEPVHFILSKNECASLSSFFLKVEDFIEVEEIARLDEENRDLGECDDLII